MSKRDQKQLFVIYGLLIIVVVIAMLVWRGTFGEPKYTIDNSTPNWFTENTHDDYDPVMPLNGNIEQSSNFSGNYTETVNPQR